MMAWPRGGSVKGIRLREPDCSLDPALVGGRSIGGGSGYGASAGLGWEGDSLLRVLIARRRAWILSVARLWEL